MASWMPPVPRNLSATSKAAANALPASEPRNRCARHSSAPVFTKKHPPPSARRFALTLMLRPPLPQAYGFLLGAGSRYQGQRSEEHTSELQSHLNLVCRLLLDKKN